MHPIHTLLSQGFDSFYKKLVQQVELGNVDRQEWINGLVLFDYSRQCQFEQAWNEITIVARGLVLDVPNKKIAALPFPKFFNLGQHNTSFKDLPYSAYEKMDGSLGIAFYVPNYGWKVNTRGSFLSEQALKAQQMIRTEMLDTNLTYLFEIIYPENKIVINYKGKEELTLLGAYNNNTYEEITPDQLDEFAKTANYPRPKRYNFTSFEQLQEIVKVMPKDEEGVVVHFSDGSRLKVKGDEYCRFHAILSHFSPIQVWGVVRDCKEVDYLKEIPDECHEEYNLWADDFKAKFNSIAVQLAILQDEYKTVSDKELGLILQGKVEGKTLPYLGRFLFPIRKNGLKEIMNVKPMGLRYGIFDLFRPKGNVVSKLVKKLEE